MLIAHKILGLLMALMLVGSNMVLSGHISSHTTTDSELCSLCIHPGGPDSAITPVPVTYFAIPTTLEIASACTPTCFSHVNPYDHQSRAPPAVT